jgi:hypothetical protein
MFVFQRVSPHDISDTEEREGNGVRHLCLHLRLT